MIAFRQRPWLIIGMALAVILITVGNPFLTFGAGSSTAFWQLLLPRSVMATCVGAVLAVCGTVLQNVLRNELASPYTLGISSGATLGAAVVVRFGSALFAEFAWLTSIPLLSPLVFAAFIGSLSTVLFIDVVAQRFRGQMTLVLAGIGLSLWINAIVTALFLIGDAPNYKNLLIWLMGRLVQVGYHQLIGLIPFVILGFGLLVSIWNELNILALDDDSAQSLGVDIVSVRRRALLASSLLTAAVVAFVGPIGFVGLIVPHAVRLFTGPDIRIVLPVAACVGGVALNLCDLVARSLLYPEELAIGIITAFFGCPLFLLLLIRKQQRRA